MYWMTAYCEVQMLPFVLGKTCIVLLSSLPRQNIEPDIGPAGLGEAV